MRNSKLVEPGAKLEMGKSKFVDEIEKEDWCRKERS
jgi:hypothetical protein